MIPRDDHLEDAAAIVFSTVRPPLPYRLIARSDDPSFTLPTSLAVTVGDSLDAYKGRYDPYRVLVLTERCIDTYSDETALRRWVSSTLTLSTLSAGRRAVYT